MGILKGLKAAWKAATLEEKIEFIISGICGFGCGALIWDVNQKVLPNHSKIEKAAISVVVSGLGLKAGVMATEGIMDCWVTPAIAAADAIKDAVEASEKKEEAGNGSNK